MGKYTERLDIKMTPEDMALLAEGAIKKGLPLTVYARTIILSQLNPLLGGVKNDEFSMANNKKSPMEDGN